jgi:hypothetical protein
MRSRILALVAAGTLAMAGSTLLTTTAHAATDAQLSVFHGVPGLTVDVYVNGKRTLNDFKPGMMAGPLQLAPGTYTVAITKGDAKDDSSPAIGPVKLKLAAGGNYTAVAHLMQNGKPTATLFSNDISKTAAGQGRLTVRHVAAAPAVDIRAGGKAVVSNLSNPDEKVLNLPAGTVSASVTATGQKKALIGPANVAVKDGVNTIVYAWGSLNDKNLNLAVQTISGLHSGPGGVNAGEAGLAADRSPAPLVGGGLLLVAGVALIARRRLAAVRAV